MHLKHKRGGMYNKIYLGMCAIIRDTNAYFLFLHKIFYKVIYPDSFEIKSGFYKIREILRSYCYSPFGISKVETLSFLNNHASIVHLLDAANEFIIINNDDDSFPMESSADVTEALSRIRPHGTWMDEEEFMALLRALLTIEKQVRFFSNRKEKYPVSFEVSSKVPLFGFLAVEIKRVFDEAGNVKDSASPELKKIREQIIKTQSGINHQIDRLLKKAKSEGLIAVETQPSIRDGRLVIPVEARNKRKLSGIIHDESATGKTSYIEPAEVVEAHNKLKTYHHEEKREIVKILIALTDHVRPYTKDIIESFNFLAFTDVNYAKAKFAKALQCICPKVSNNTVVYWKNAVHPLLYLNHKKENKSIVPLNIELNDKQRILIISGPNAGGKSVCLKTIAILQYMLQCGLPVPVNEASEMGIFERIFIDIGDEQSIDNDLSTYSSHLLNMKHFLRNATEKTLLLVDEFGTGTEPKLGGAIAESILSHLNKTGAFGVINTHYGNLKHFATETEGVINGAMLFDLHLMQPQYILQIGEPGSSYAIEIARKIGIPEEVINDAADKIGEDHFKYDKHLREIVRDKKYWEKKRNSVRQKDKQLNLLISTLEEEKETLNKQRKEILQKAKQEADLIYNKANATIENVIREIKEGQAEKESTQKAREKMEAEKESIRKSAESEMRISKNAHRIIQQQQRKKPKTKKEQSSTPDAIIIKGDVVRLEGQTGTGNVIAIKGKEAEIAFGNFRSIIPLKKLEKVSGKQRKREASIHISNPMLTDSFKETKLNFKHEIDLRGQRADEALQKITEFIDQALMVGAKQVRILHGTGTGALRQLTRQYLATISYVDSFNDERVDLGGAGITVVNMDF